MESSEARYFRLWVSNFVPKFDLPKIDVNKLYRDSSELFLSQIYKASIWNYRIRGSDSLLLESVRANLKELEKRSDTDLISDVKQAMKFVVEGKTGIDRINALKYDDMSLNLYESNLDDRPKCHQPWLRRRVLSFMIFARRAVSSFGNKEGKLWTESEDSDGTKYYARRNNVTDRLKFLFVHPKDGECEFQSSINQEFVSGYQYVKLKEFPKLSNFIKRR